MASTKSIFTSPQSNTRLSNQGAILSALLQYGTISRSDLAEQIGVSPTTITNIITDLIDRGIVEDAPQQDATTQAKVGRPRTALQLIADSRYAIGIYVRTGLLDIGITNVKAELVSQFEMPFDLAEDPDAVFEKALDLIIAELKTLRIPLNRVLGIGVGAQGRVDAQAGINVFAPNLRWREILISEIVAQYVNLPVCVDNNIRLMALGEARFGGHKDVSNLAFVHVEGGVGAGFVIDGNTHHGADASAGEIGHTTILPENGELCSCGNHGCLETLISEDALVHAAERIAKATNNVHLINCLKSDTVDPLDCIFDEARAGNQDVLKMLHKRATYMGIALANLVNLINPELILLGGRIYAKGTDFLLPTTLETLEKRSFAELGKRVELQIVPPESKPGLVGAAGLALDHFFYRQQPIVYQN